MDKREEIKPDAWVIRSPETGKVLWHEVEASRSAFSPDWIEDGWEVVPVYLGSAPGMRWETRPEHIARDMEEGRSPQQSERRQVPDIMQASEALRLLAAEDERNDKIHDLLEAIREQIRNEIDPAARPDELFTNIQNAVYAFRGRTRLTNDAAIVSALRRVEEQAARIAELEKERDVAWESREWHRVSMECQTENLIESQARLSEAVKVLERLAEGEMSDTGHTALREAAKAFIATLGENKNEA